MEVLIIWKWFSLKRSTDDRLSNSFVWLSGLSLNRLAMKALNCTTPRTS